MCTSIKVQDLKFPFEITGICRLLKVDAFWIKASFVMIFMTFNSLGFVPKIIPLPAFILEFKSSFPVSGNWGISDEKSLSICPIKTEEGTQNQHTGLHCGLANRQRLGSCRAKCCIFRVFPSQWEFTHLPKRF